MNSIDVSIIIPIYNGEKYLDNLVKQLNEQKIEKVEVIFINDGSNDGSLHKLSAIENSKNNNFFVSVINQENGGICRARNKGLDVANGEYVLFIDQDDKLKPNAIKTLLDTIREQSADVVLAGYELIDINGNVLEKTKLVPGDPWSIFQINAPWARIFKRSIIEENSIRFFITKISEDFYFNYKYLSFCKKIVVIDDIVYQWLLNKQSESHANMSQYSEDRNLFEMLSNLHADINKNHSLNKDCLEYGILKHIIWYMFYVAKSTSREMLTRVHDDGIKWLKQYYPKCYQNPYLSFGKPKTEKIANRIIVKAAIALERCHLLNFFLHLYAGNLFK